MSKRNRKKGMPNLEAIEKGIREEARRATARKAASLFTSPLISEAEAERLIAEMEARGEHLVEAFTQAPVPRERWKAHLMRSHRGSPEDAKTMLGILTRAKEIAKARGLNVTIERTTTSDGIESFSANVGTSS